MNSFVLANRSVVTSLAELRDILPTLDDVTYAHHAQPNRNDFARWIALELDQPLLAHQARLAQSREDLYRLLSRELGQHTSQLSAPQSRQNANESLQGSQERLNASNTAIIETPASAETAVVRAPTSSAAATNSTTHAMTAVTGTMQNMSTDVHARLALLENQVLEFIQMRSQLRSNLDQYLEQKSLYLRDIATRGAIHDADLKELSSQRIALEKRIQEMAHELAALKMILPPQCAQFLSSISKAANMCRQGNLAGARDIYAKLYQEFSSIDPSEKALIHKPLRALYDQIRSLIPATSARQ